VTAAERAAEVIERAIADWGSTVNPSDWSEVTDPAPSIAAALMADPALLVDLAIEAGWLEPGEPWAEYENPLWWPDGGAAKVVTDMSLDKFYRRTTQENDQ
jgi:hypothetical protein